MRPSNPSHTHIPRYLHSCSDAIENVDILYNCNFEQLEEKNRIHAQFKKRAAALNFWTNKSVGAALLSWRDYVRHCGSKALEEKRLLALHGRQTRLALKQKAAEQDRRHKAEAAKLRYQEREAEIRRIRNAFTAAVNARGKLALRHVDDVPKPQGRPDRTPSVSRATMIQFIRNSPMLGQCSDEAIDKLCKQTAFVRFPRHSRILEEGAQGDTLMCLVEGECDIYVNGGHVMRMGAAPFRHGEINEPMLVANGSMIGEMGVLTGDVRSATVIASTKMVKMIEIRRKLLQVWACVVGGGECERGQETGLG